MSKQSCGRLLSILCTYYSPDLRMESRWSHGLLGITPP